MVQEQKITFSRQFFALFYKNFALQRHQWSTTICQLLVPIILVIVIGIFQLIVDSQVSNLAALQPPDRFPRLNLSRTVYPPKKGQKPGLNGIPYFRFAQGDASLHGPLDMGVLDSFGKKSGFLGNISQAENFISPDFGNFTNFVKVESISELDRQLIEIYSYWKVLLHDSIGFGPRKVGDVNVFTGKNSSRDLDHIVKQVGKWLLFRNYTLLPPFGAFVFNELDQNALDVVLMPGGRYGGWAPDPLLRKNVSKLEIIYPEIDRKGNMMNLMSNAFSKYHFGPDAPIIEAGYRGFTQKVLNPFDLASILGVYLLGFALSFLLPTFISNIVVDRHDRILLMMEMSGLKLSVYWLVTFIYNMFTYSAVIAGMWITGALFGMKVFVQTNFWLLLFIFILWGIAMNALAFFFASFFKVPRSASISAYFIVIIGVIVSNLLNGTVYLNELPPWWYFIYPPFAFYRSLFIMEDACIRLQCLSFNNVEEISFIVHQFTLVILMLLGMSVVLAFIGWLRRRSCDENNQSIFDRVIKSVSRKWRRSAGHGDQENLAAGIVEFEDESVASERQMVAGENFQVAGKSLVVKQFSHQYGDDNRWAVRDFNLALVKGETFGLLGSNGAGKTTLISCLTGLLKPSEGEALYDGGNLSLSKDLQKIQSRIGVCMQFDIFYPKLTVHDHIIFYCRLKGIAGAELKKHVGEVIDAIGLTAVKDREARFLSGGMRRRLSFGIALIGNPELIVLDEPSTGLDPLTKRNVWKVFKEIRKRRAEMGDPLTVILTTHSMDEADELCDRISIMSKGRLRCIGSSEYLKQKFSTGYKLSVQVKSVPIASYPSTSQTNGKQKQMDCTLIQYIQRTLEEAVCGDCSLVGEQDSFCAREVITNSGFKILYLPGQSVKHLIVYQVLFPFTESSSNFGSAILEVIKRMTRARKEIEQFKLRPTDSNNIIIEEWGLDRTNLEDVFLNVVRM